MNNSPQVPDPRCARSGRASSSVVMAAALAVALAAAAAGARGPDQPGFEATRVKPVTGNRVGWTYQSITSMPGQRPAADCGLCATECLKNPLCMAWTCFHPSGHYAPEAVRARPLVCHLKSDMPPLSPQDMSVIKRQTSGNGVRLDICYTSSAGPVHRLPVTPARPEDRVSRNYAVPDPAPPAGELAAEAGLLTLIDQNNTSGRLGEIYPIAEGCGGPRGPVPPPPPPPPVDPRTAIVGTWTWFNGAVVTAHANGTISSSMGHTGIWRCPDPTRRKIEFDWTKGPDGPWYDKLTISDDGTRLEGQNQNGTFVSAKKKQ